MPTKKATAKTKGGGITPAPTSQHKFGPDVLPAALMNLLPKVDGNEDSMPDLTNELALADGFVALTIQASKNGNVFSSRERKELVSGMTLINEGMSKRQKDRVNEGIRRLNDLATQAKDARGWSQEIRDWLELRRRLSDSQRRNESKAKNVIPAKQVELAFARLVELIYEGEMTDATRKTLVSTILQMMGRPVPDAAEKAG